MEYKCLKCGTINTNLVLSRSTETTMAEVVSETLPYETSACMTCEDDFLLTKVDTEGSPQTEPTLFGTTHNVGCWLCGNVNPRKFKRIN